MTIFKLYNSVSDSLCFISRVLWHHNHIRSYRTFHTHTPSVEALKAFENSLFCKIIGYKTKGQNMFHTNLNSRSSLCTLPFIFNIVFCTHACKVACQLSVCICTIFYWHWLHSNLRFVIPFPVRKWKYDYLNYLNVTYTYICVNSSFSGTFINRPSLFVFLLRLMQ